MLLLLLCGAADLAEPLSAMRMDTYTDRANTGALVSLGMRQRRSAAAAPPSSEWDRWVMVFGVNHADSMKEMLRIFGRYGEVWPGPLRGCVCVTGKALQCMV